MSNPRIALMQKKLQEALAPSKLEIIDESEKHVGHAGAKNGAGHFAVHIEAAVFKGKTEVERHRLVYQALRELMGSEIHALRISAKVSS